MKEPNAHTVKALVIPFVISVKGRNSLRTSVPLLSNTSNILKNEIHLNDEK